MSKVFRGKDNCTGSFGHPMDHVSLRSLDVVWATYILVGSKLLGESQIRWWSGGCKGGCSTEARHAQSFIKIDKNCPGCSISGPFSRRQASVTHVPANKSAVRCMKSMTNSQVSGSWREWLCEVEASPLANRWIAKSATKSSLYRGQVRTVKNGTMTSPPAHLGRSSHDAPRWNVGRVAEAKSCGCTRSTAESSNRSRKVLHICTEALASSGRRLWSKTSKSTVPWSRIPAVQGDHHFAPVMAFSRFGSSQLPRNHPHVAVLAPFCG